ncbi:hypothetical protein KAJ27_02030 [bacterium]|nr:hypothetical protein [bacterium]
MNNAIKYMFILIFVFLICEFKVYSNDIQNKDMQQNSYKKSKNWSFPYWSGGKIKTSKLRKNSHLNKKNETAKKVFRQSNSSGWTLETVPSASKNYTVTITGPFPVVWNQINVNGAKKGYMDNRSNWKLRKWTFVLPPATTRSVTLEFFGEKPYKVPFSNLNSPTANKQKLWITKTFPVVKTGLIPDPEKSINTFEPLTPPGIVQKNIKESWTVANPSNIFLKLGAYVIFKWTFPNQLGSSPTIIRGKIKIGKSMTSKIFNSKLRQDHIFNKSGVYNIKLNLQFTEIIQSGDKIFPVRRNYDYSKKIVVVKQLQKYLGNILSTITPPASVKEDIESPFLFSSMFYFANKSSGIEPGTITYKIDWGDGNVSKEIKYPGTDTDSIGSSTSTQNIKIKGIKHKYHAPGNYIVRIIVKYKERHYRGHDYKIHGPLTHIQTKDILVRDQTPPVFVNNVFEKLHGTSGDPLEIKIKVKDNDPLNPISKAILHYSMYPAGWHSYDSPTVWNKINTVIKKIDFQTWTVSGKIPLPIDFATKSFPKFPRKSMKKLNYYFEIIDNTGNVNHGDLDILDNNDIKKKYCKNGTDFGEIIVKDNDPPSLWIFIENKHLKRKFTFEVSGGEKDFYESDNIYGKVRKYCSDSMSSMVQNESITEKPLLEIIHDKLTPFEFKSYSINIQENMDIEMYWKVHDSVDGKRPLMSNGIPLKKMNFNFKKFGTKKIDFYSFDSKNPDSSVNGRKMIIDFIIQKPDTSN